MSKRIIAISIVALLFFGCGKADINDLIKNKIKLDSKEQESILAIVNSAKIDNKNMTVFIDEYMPLADNYISIENNHIVELRINNSNLDSMSGISAFFALRYLDLSSNQIHRLQDLDNASVLESLYLSNNQISKIENLENLINLKELVLTANNLTVITGLDSLVNLTSLHLENQNSPGITKIENLDNLHSLILLNLDANNINQITDLQNLTALETLSLNTNKISNIEALKNIGPLKHVFLSNNQINYVPEWTNRLETFDVNNNPIKEVEKSPTEAIAENEGENTAMPSASGYISGKSETYNLSYGLGISGNYQLSIKSLNGTYANYIKLNKSTAPSTPLVSLDITSGSGNLYIYLVDERGQWTKYLISASQKQTIKGYLTKFAPNEYQFYLEAVDSKAKNISIYLSFL
ncbi:MAG: leucine-rich protein [Candidatus Peregrinibacteria bacterium GW2011_GWF2_33_10]|nr:MAG: leucine-rich protein [Candidatus Peregrinibacteria bacterium GW2011_GWF2_33_10]OGJ44590.1 MAG: hypothetical protein A2272_01725 [Candidatus Peregrinibacteria bacterium RIFOXYA12_FULL_33_12]OGJ44920.1 MAG: hypothetical protein A2263_03275 [Candidatus Peregrinibacteria bacterium RIFOXYA2_FULL_33_21]OGJ50679.1 MAG: hypothetical protein A2307_03565 [Candidatus Peregrinibacteria bacterium RIFOXYB2_FULL_33_20]